ncbi:2-(1,2-epoxy-1,2-dihydrophenyl)acetyl-CoA isomerase [Echinicola soli]|uniref:2-(1,2-epoxy-1,2-dihydrophenyl)acetyl-CoA isomerase n=1 Tax=Echinicola soli TaxID=2591634 RepID=A0A514CCM5_9BACT|nr:enoyl-CoA hydratase-related protein [Echinicola soli]QDH77567.1 2-(1,2-epoxy-1,2-dihydrophenyl)acetyl-CoA isomerase [Echinicola soli]
MAYKYITYTLHANWVEIAINRPEVYNALNRGVLEELKVAFGQAGETSDIRCIVLTGAGKAFCSGQDLKAVGNDLDNIPFKEIIRDYYNPLILLMRRLSKPIICKLNGVAAGAGCSLALAADVIIASKDTYLAEIFAHIGLVMDAGSTYFLPKRVGYPLAFELATTGRKVFAEEAEKLGLVNKAVEHTTLDEVVAQYIEVYVNASANAVGMIKEMLNRADGMSLEAVVEMEAEYQEKAGRHRDFREGVVAFLEKRKPRFE